MAALADGFVASPGGLGTIEEFFEAALDRAASLIEETGASVSAPHVHEHRAELARRRGDDAGRERELREAHRLYVEVGATEHAKNSQTFVFETPIRPVLDRAKSEGY